MEAERGEFKDHWRELDEYVYPVSVGSNENRNARLDNTGEMANEIFSATLAGNLANPATPWFEIEPVAESEREDKEIMAWAEIATRLFRSILSDHRTNFYASTFTEAMEIGARGNVGSEVIESKNGAPFVCISESIAGAFRPIAHELGLTQKQAEGLAKWNNDMGAKLAEEAFNSGQEALKKDWQNKYDENVGKAQTFFKGIAADVDGADAFLAKFGNDPAVVRMFHSMAVKFGEGGVMRGAGNDAQLTVAQIDEQIAKIRGDADYKNLMSPRYNDLDKEIQALYRKKVAAAA